MIKESGYRFEYKDSRAAHSTVVTLHEDATIYSVVDAFKSFLLSSGFHTDTVDRVHVVDKSDD